MHAAGGGYADLLDNFDDDMAVRQDPDSDLQSQLATLDQQIDNQLAQGTAP